MIIDNEQRMQATNPELSFIVQAPAGSGKTEILSQRFLRLLSKVTAPEQIVALTFTRKAASEMKERIIRALQQAALNKPASSPHQQLTLEYANQALQQSIHHQWDLLLQPNRLKIITIDALCQSINQAVPLLERQIAYSNITDKPASHYLKAARNCIQFAIQDADYQPAIKTLLLHVDNKQDRLLELFKALLAQRDQWMFAFFQARSQAKETFEQAIYLIEEHELTRFKHILPVGLANELRLLVSQLASIENDPSSPRYILKDWFNFAEITQEMVLSLRKTLLTNEPNFRKSFDHHVGLKKDICTADEYKKLKEASKQLLFQLQAYPDFLHALLQVSQLPNPQYDEEQWEVLQALFTLLPLLLGHLQVIFSEYNEVDFTAISQQALIALGDEECPTDLALYLDNAIHHLLIDEFQDTSISQFDLLTKLVQGWQAGDGKTIFVVGDPMQSIYRFRQAEVGLFFRAKAQGIGAIPLHPLALQCNFRSTPTLVNWVNHQFKTIFPQQVDIESGAVAFHASTPVIKDKSSSAIQAIHCKNRLQEAAWLIDIIQNELLADSMQTIAILVRSRTHLKEIIKLLRTHHIPYQGTDIDLLANLTHLRDVWTLTHALLTPGNRLTWLALLRSPYVGLALQDLHSIAQFNKNKSIYYALTHLDKIQALSEEGRIRAAFFSQVMQQALMLRYQDKLSTWVAQTLKQLHADKILEPHQFNDLEQLWTLIDSYEQEGRLPDMREFLIELKKLYSQEATPARLHIMTIHKSKGLEFDTVILPSLGAKLEKGASPLLRWLKLPTHHHGNLLLVSPIQAAHHASCALYNYLKLLDEEKSNYEAQRLLYVAVTRAKTRLYLINSSANPASNSFYNLLKHQAFITTEEVLAIEEKKAMYIRPTLTKLPLEFYTAATFSTTLATAVKLSIIPGTARLIGIITHQVLQWICTNHPSAISDIPWSLVEYECKRLGFENALQQHALDLVKTQIKQLFADPIGLWIIAHHDKEHNEYELLVEVHNNLVTRIIDRTFEDAGKLWIIDFKTGTDAVNLQETHQNQLNSYSQYLSNRSSLPIHCGLYYLNTNYWHTWQYENTIQCIDN